MKKTTKAKKTTRTTKTTARKKQKTLDSLSLADGKAEVEKVRELEQLLGVDQMNIFKTNNLEVFKEELSEDKRYYEFSSIFGWKKRLRANFKNNKMSSKKNKKNI